MSPSETTNQIQIGCRAEKTTVVTVDAILKLQRIVKLKLSRWWLNFHRFVKGGSFCIKIVSKPRRRPRERNRPHLVR